MIVHQVRRLFTNLVRHYLFFFLYIIDFHLVRIDRSVSILDKYIK